MKIISKIKSFLKNKKAHKDFEKTMVEIPLKGINYHWGMRF